LSELRLPDGAVYVTGDTAAKSYWDGETVKGIVVKADAERRYTLTVAYPANSPDAAVARDGFQDFASPEAVEKAAHSFMRNGSRIGAYHQDGTEGFGECVESYIYRGPDWPVEAADGSTQVIKAGDWLIGTIWTPDAWTAIKSGEASGVSMQGGAVRNTPSPQDVARVVAARNARG
jgi:hypothetical protein